MLELGFQDASRLAFRLDRRKTCVPEGKPVFEDLVDKIRFPDTAPPIDCDKLRPAAAIESLQLLCLMLPADHKQSITASFWSVKCIKILLTDRF